VTAAKILVQLAEDLDLDGVRPVMARGGGRGAPRRAGDRGRPGDCATYPTGHAALADIRAEGATNDGYQTDTHRLTATAVGETV
jgi:hypothetical protein